LAVEEKFDMVFMKVFFFLFWTENTFQKLQKIKNVLLFFYYIKFGLKRFIVIYFILNPYLFIFFQFHQLEYDLI